MGYTKKKLFLALILNTLCVFVMANDLPHIQAQSPKHTLSVVASFKNEARNLKEWIEYHRLVGVDHFYLYNSCSRDQSVNTLSSYVKAGLVTVINWHDLPMYQKENDAAAWALCVQVPAFEHALKFQAYRDTKWLVYLDIDEFLVPTQGNNLQNLLEQYENHPGIIIKSDYFDASANVFPKRKLLIETLELIGNVEQNILKTVEKTILKPDQCETFSWPPYKYRFKQGKTAISIGRQELRINRYANRSNGAVYFGKIRDKLHVDNRYLSEDEISEFLGMGYQIEDQERAIHRFVPDLLKKLGYESGWSW